MGTTESTQIAYTNGIRFDHTFEIINLNDETAKKFDVLLGVDILPKLFIYLSGVAHRWDDDSAKERNQFKNNINYDTDNAYDPENTDNGTPEERAFLMKQIEGSLEANKQILIDAVCSIPKSGVNIPISNPNDC
ncbi:hypothetical protein [Parasitella parasitica]|uniref:Uncharacterized protein n=1 Tax=Parasitella parasitica TaxID=35722 RepID=A0A0B7NDM1_9FUNG|nr:hypothetical protein [Parasitella parasitica]